MALRSMSVSNCEEGAPVGEFLDDEGVLVGFGGVAGECALAGAVGDFDLKLDGGWGLGIDE